MDGGAQGLEAELLTHAAWMRALARRLVADDARADDAAQEAALAALETPRAARQPRAWLGQVVRNAARRLGRAEGRRARREARAARPEALPSAAELAAEAEVQHALVAALLALEEPYRSALVLRFYRGLEPSEIARLEGVPPGTVRSRVARGLELLRARLDARPGGRAAWSAVLAPAAWNTAPRGGSPAAAAALTGGLAVGVKVALACAVGAAAVAGAVVLFRGSPQEPAQELAVARTPAEAPLAGAEARDGGGEIPGAGLSPAAAAEERVAIDARAAPGRTRAVRVIARNPDGMPVAGAAVALSPYAQPEPVLAAAETDAEGRARLELPADQDAPLHLAWSAPGLIGANTEADDLAREIELAFRWASALRGVVRDAETGAPLAGANIGRRGGLTGADGRYRLEGLMRGVRGSFTVHREGYVEQTASYLVNEPEGELDIALARGFPLALLVYDRETGLPLGGAPLAAHSFSAPFGTTDAEGRATLRAAVGTELALHISAPGYCALRWVWTPEAEPAETEVRVPLPRLAAIEGRVLDEQGQPLAGAFLYAPCEHEHARLHRLTEDEQVGLGLLDYAGYEAGNEAATDEQGRFRLAVVPCGAVRTLTAGHADFPTREVALGAPLAPGETLPLDVRLSRGATVRGRVLENGAPWSGARLAWKDARGSYGDFARADEDGRYELSVSPGPGSVVLFGGPTREALDERGVSVAGGEVAEVDFALEVEMAEIRGRVTEAGEPLADATVAASNLESGGLREYTAKTDSEGAYRLDVPAGQVFQVRTGRRPTMRWRDRVPAGAQGVDFDLPALGTLRLRLVDAATGKPVRMRGTQIDGLFWHASGEGRYEAAQADPDLDGRQDLAVAAGAVDVLVHLCDDGYARRAAAGISVPPGGESELVTLALERAPEARLAFAGEGVAPRDLDGHLLFLLEGSELGLVQGPFPDEPGLWNHRINGIQMRLDSPTLITQLVQVGADGRALVQGLSPGRYHLRVYPNDFAFEPEAFDLPAAGEEPIAVRWKRR